MMQKMEICPTKEYVAKNTRPTSKYPKRGLSLLYDLIRAINTLAFNPLMSLNQPCSSYL